MSRLTELMRVVKQLDPQLGADLDAELQPLQRRLPFGLNFERHAPEAVELPGHKVRVGSKVRVLPPRGISARGDQRLWVVTALAGGMAELAPLDGSEQDEPTTVAAADLVLVSEFRDQVFPGLRLDPNGEILEGDDRPFHTVINGENYHALKLLTFTHAHSIDAIYIDPPYNTGARDWKYNNDYVEGEDLYRHSKWLAFMERRLKLAKQLLNPADSVLIVTIDEKEYLRLGLLLEQIFTSDAIQMVTSVINPMGSRRADEFSRVEEYVFVVRLGAAAVPDSTRTMLDRAETETKSVGEAEVRWTPLHRDGNGWERSARPNLFYPVFVDPDTLTVAHVGESLPLTTDRSTVADQPGLVTVWPMKGEREARWQVGQDTLRELVAGGWVSVTSVDAQRSTASIRYLTSGAQTKVSSGVFRVTGTRPNGSNIVTSSGAVEQRPRSVWVVPSHSARDYGTSLLRAFLPDRKFPYPKSLYAVEDALRFFVGSKPEAVVLDFFSGSGTTAHAVMRLNAQDDGARQCISVTNNEVSADEHAQLRKQQLRPGDDAWEEHGIAEHITKPRIRAAITGRTPSGDVVKGDYKFVDPFPMADGFKANAAFFTLIYESPYRVSTDRAFAAIAPMLWLRAGARGRRIEHAVTSWELADTYGIIKDLDQVSAFLAAIRAKPSIRIAYIVTDDEGRYQQLAAELPGVETVRLYEDYLRNCQSNVGD